MTAAAKDGATADPGVRLGWLALVVVGLAVLLGLWAWSASSERWAVALYKARPRVLHFGPPAEVGHCRVKETDDPTSDVLANLLDVDADGRSEYRMMGFIDGSAAICERRWHGLWLGDELKTCDAASRSCTAEKR